MLLNTHGFSRRGFSRHRHSAIGFQASLRAAGIVRRLSVVYCFSGIAAFVQSQYVEILQCIRPVNDR